MKVIAGRGDSFFPQVDFFKVPRIDSLHPDILVESTTLASGKVSKQFEELRDNLINDLSPLLSEVDVCIIHNALTLHKNLPLTAALYTLSREQPAKFVAWCHDFAWQDNLYIPDLHSGYPWDLLRSHWPDVKYVVVSHHSRKKLSSLTGLEEEKIEVVHPGVDITKMFKLESETLDLIERLNLFKANPILLLPARITRRKNIEFAIEVMSILVRYNPHAVLLVTGPPGPHNPTNIEYLKALKKRQVESGVADHVFFLYELNKGEPFYVTDSMMADLYQISDLLFFPSRHEGFGIPVIEAGLTRLPIFAASLPSIRESSNDLIHCFDLESDPVWVAESITDYLKRDLIYQMKQRVLSRFTWHSIVKQKLIPIIHKVSGLPDETNQG